MKGSPRRTRHLIFLAHVWLCAPFLYIWLMIPSVRASVSLETFYTMRLAVFIVLLYLVVRTVLAFRDPKWLPWEYVYPPIDVAIISCLIYLGDRDPMSKLSLFYFFPLAEAASTLRVAWAAVVAVMAFTGAVLATEGLKTRDPYGATFQYVFLLIIASLMTTLAKVAARLQEQLGVAKDRERIAAEMHDGVQGHLITVAAQLELAQQVGRVDPSRGVRIAQDSREAALLAADELRFLVHRMRSPSLRAEFLAALRQFADNQTSRNGLALDFQIEGSPMPLQPEVENTLFRIAQESLTNVLRHASARHVRVKVSYSGRNASLEITDDGIGFCPDAEDRPRAGIEGMISRAQGMGGKLTITSAPGQGTTVHVTLPRELPWRDASK